MSRMSLLWRYTSLGHGEETWKNPVFRRMILGALRLATGMVDAEIAPNAESGDTHPNENHDPAEDPVRR